MKPKEVTKAELKQFWNHSINPVTGYRIFTSDIYTIREKEERNFVRLTRLKFNKE